MFLRSCVTAGERIKAAFPWLLAASASLLMPCAAYAHSAAATLAGGKPASTASALPAPQDWCITLAPRLPKVSAADCRSLQLQASGIRSNNGFPLLSRDYPAGPAHPRALRALLLGGIHGDELSSSAIVFKWMAAMPKNNTEFNWKVAPVVNPDGLLAPRPVRMNARGIDLNRNFPTPDWQKEAPAYWARVTRKDPRRYPGKAPVSEPESRWVHDLIDSYQPDVVISVHAPFGVLDFDGPSNPPSRFGRLVYNRVGVYPGSLGNYSGVHKDIPVVTIELPNATQLPPDAEIQRIWNDMQSWLRKNIKSNLRTASVKR